MAGTCENGSEGCKLNLQVYFQNQDSIKSTSTIQNMQLCEGRILSFFKICHNPMSSMREQTEGFSNEIIGLYQDANHFSILQVFILSCSNRTCQLSAIGAPPPEKHDPVAWVRENMALSHWPKQKRLNFSIAAMNSLQCSTGVQRKPFLEWVHMKVVLYQVTGMLEKQLDNSRVARGPVPPVHALSQSILCAAIEWRGFTYTLCTTANFSQTLQHPSKFPCSWNHQGRRWYHREGILLNNCFIGPCTTEYFLPRKG